MVRLRRRPARLPPCQVGPGSPDHLVPSLHLAVPVRFFHFVPAKSFQAKPSLSSPSMLDLHCLAFTELNSCSSALAILSLPCCPTNSCCVADHVARVARDHKAAGVPLACSQGQLLFVELCHGGRRGPAGLYLHGHERRSVDGSLRGESVQRGQSPQGPASPPAGP